MDMIQESLFKIYNASAGSGKTFRLVTEYLKIVIVSPNADEYRKILAITFTNKAAAEMKERVLKTLNAGANNEENPILQTIAKEIGWSIESVNKKCNIVLKAILFNYTAFNIATIDSFTHRLVKTFAFDLGLAVDFEVEMDGKSKLAEVVDLLIDKIGLDKHLTYVLLKFTVQNIEEDKSWDISRSLNEVASMLLSEENERELLKLIHVSDEDFVQLQKKLQDYKNNILKEFKDLGDKVLNIFTEYGLPLNVMAFSDYPNHFAKFQRLAIDKIATEGRLEKNIANGVLVAKGNRNKKEFAEWVAIVDGMEDEFFAYYYKSIALYKKHAKVYFYIEAVLKSLVPLSVMSHLYHEFLKLKQDQNILLNVELNKIVGDELKNEPVPYIYERIGERFSYFFIDEMQDTSERQWENLLPLLGNALAQENALLMIVGDAKQSIYRWRGGKAAQFINLTNQTIASPFVVPKSIETLDTNFRSYSEIVKFNNDFFSFIAKELSNSRYQEIYEQEKYQKLNTKEGGYLKIELFESLKGKKKGLEAEESDLTDIDIINQKVLQTIQEAKSQGFNYGDICVLIRRNSVGGAIANFLVENGLSVISPDSLMLENHPLIKNIVFLLKWLDNHKNVESLVNAGSYLYEKFNNQQLSLHGFLMQLKNCNTIADLNDFLRVEIKEEDLFSNAISEAIEYILRVFKFVDVADVYIQTFVEEVWRFQQRKKGSITEFLLYWELQKHKIKINIAQNSSAIQLMTIHKSKGLEFPVVIYPEDIVIDDASKDKIWLPVDEEAKPLFAPIESFRFNLSGVKNLTQQSEQVYEDYMQEVQLDNFNLIYVAFTRAVEQLYIILPYQSNKKTLANLCQAYIHAKTGEVDRLLYTEGNAAKYADSVEESKDYELHEYISEAKEVNNIEVVYDLHTDALDYGVLLHKTFEKIKSSSDFSKAIVFLKNICNDDAVVSQIEKHVQMVLTHPELIHLYNGTGNVLNERPIVNHNGLVLIPDRVIVKDNFVSVIDYKTGNYQEIHKDQIKTYGSFYKNIGYEVKELMIVYFHEGFIEINMIL